MGKKFPYEHPGSYLRELVLKLRACVKVETFFGGLLTLALFFNYLFLPIHQDLDRPEIGLIETLCNWLSGNFF